MTLYLERLFFASIASSLKSEKYNQIHGPYKTNGHLNLISCHWIIQLFNASTTSEFPEGAEFPVTFSHTLSWDTEELYKAKQLSLNFHTVVLHQHKKTQAFGQNSGTMITILWSS